MIRGKFIVLEGLEGAGKSTAHQAVLAKLEELGIKDVVLTREPGGTPLAEKLRHLIKYDLEEPICDKAELLMLYGAGVRLVERVIATICHRKRIRVEVARLIAKF